MNASLGSKVGHALLGATVAACGSSGGGGPVPEFPACNEAPCTPFGDLDGLGPGARARRIGDEFRVTGQRLLASPEGESWLLWRSHAGPTDHAGTLHLHQYDARGIRVATSTLAAFAPDDLVLHKDGRLTGWRNQCGVRQDSVCLAAEHSAGAVRESTWRAVRRTVTTYILDWEGAIHGTETQQFERRVLVRAADAAGGLYAVTNEAGYFIARLGDDWVLQSSRSLFPRVVVAGVDENSPLEDLVRAAAIAQQAVSRPVAVNGGVVVAAAVARGTIAALNVQRGLNLPLPNDTACADILVIRVPDDGRDPDYWVVPTDACESLPKLTVVDGHAVVASILPIAKTPSPNDTEQYDMGVSLVEFATSRVQSAMFGADEDEWVEAIAPCGGGRACLAGVFGSQSVDTGSVVTFGDGFIIPVSMDGLFGSMWTLTSARHATVRDLVAIDRGDVLFFATTNGPITHTGDNDRTLNFNEGVLGVVTP